MRRFFKVKNFFLISFLAIAGIFSAASISSNIKSEETSVMEEVEAASFPSKGKSRVNVLCTKSDSTNWMQDNVSMCLVYTGADTNYKQLSRSTYFSVHSDNNQWSSVTLNGTNYAWITLEFTESERAKVTYGNFRLARGTVANHFNDCYSTNNNGTNFKNGSQNTFIMKGGWGTFYTAEYGWYNQIKVNYQSSTGASQEGYQLVYKGNAPSCPATPNGYKFDGWYEDADFTNSWTSSEQSGLLTDMELYAKYSPSGGSVIDNGKSRVWIGYDKYNPFYMDNAWIKLKIYNASDVVVYTMDSYSGTYNNNQEDLGKTVSGSSKRRYDYFDIPKTYYSDSGTYGFKVHRYSSDGSTEWNVTSKHSLYNSEAGKVYFIWGDFSTIGAASIVESGDGKNNANIDVLMSVWALNGLHTCNDVKSNDFHSFNNVRDTFIIDPASSEWRTVGNLDSHFIYDFENGDTSYSGGKTKIISAFDKFNWLNYMANGGDKPTYTMFNGVLGLTRGNGDSTPTIIIIATSSVALLSITALSVLVVKKRKSKEQ